MARWSQRAFDLETDAYVIPAVNSDWYNTGAWGTYVGLNPHRLAKKIPGRTPYSLKIALSSPEAKFQPSSGEVDRESQVKKFRQKFFSTIKNRLSSLSWTLSVWWTRCQQPR